MVINSDQHMHDMSAIGHILLGNLLRTDIFHIDCVPALMKEIHAVISTKENPCTKSVKIGKT